MLVKDAGILAQAMAKHTGIRLPEHRSKAGHAGFEDVEARPEQRSFAEVRIGVGVPRINPVRLKRGVLVMALSSRCRTTRSIMALPTTHRHGSPTHLRHDDRSGCRVPLPPDVGFAFEFRRAANDDIRFVRRESKPRRAELHVVLALWRKAV
jgi:hypothetical protein